MEYSTIDGSLFVPEMLEYNAQHSPARHPFLVYPDEKTKEPCIISNLEFNCASQRVPHAVRPGRQGQDRELVGIAYAGLIVCRMFPGRPILGDVF
ncbi:hypothetical protein EDD16DRAFT_1668889 [Pisolithus croceorrhizus]|nr:hypothetical protein EV401DRAFT_2048620 [Pisolithus croceorrhizus]KAI6097302.1 hypothetical protein EDD16DRAFT_1668889 [Pisolithus croceorrhizus]KAI6141946.1 hypothetical protein EDD17DRAFT_1712116 [Pisolithus thermaeus]